MRKSAEFGEERKALPSVPPQMQENAAFREGRKAE
jgi:hypothetical protein